MCLDQRWRREQRLPRNPNSDGPLTNSPDYSYLDGRPVPIGARRMERIEKRKLLAAKIVTMLEELDFAKKRFEASKMEPVALPEEAVIAQLKPKGHLLLKK